MMLMIALAVMSGSFPSGKQDRSGVAGDQPPRVHVSLTALRTPADGPTSVTWTSSNDLAVGATEGWGFEIKENPCSYGSLGFGDPQTRRLSWTVQFTPVSAATDKIVLDVTVERRDRSVLVKRETRHLTLAEDAPHVLDFAEVGNE